MKFSKMTRFLCILGAFLALGLLFDVGLGTTITATALGLSAGAFGMILDERCEFADATALDTGGTGLVLVGDVMDLTVARNLFNGGRPLYLVIQIDTAVTSGGSATVGFVLASDAQAAIAVDGTATEHFRTQLIAKATLVAGYVSCCIPLPGQGVPYERYLGILQNVGVAALTAGKINAFLTDTPKQWQAYDDGQ
jgi:hypothetical protein